RVPQIHPVVVLEVRGHVGPLERRAVRAIERPAGLAVPAVADLGSVQDLALPPIEAREVAAAGERRPDDAVTVDVETARPEARLGHPVELGDARMRRVLAARHADEETGIVGERRPHDVLLAGRRARLNAIDLPADASVARRIVRTARLVPRLRDLAVAVRVDHERTPALRRLLVARLVEEPRVDPAEIALAD